MHDQPVLVGWANHARLYLASLQPSKFSPVSCVVLVSTPRTCRAFQHATHCPVHTRLSCSGWSLEPRVLVDGLGAIAAVGCRYCAAHLDLLDVAIGSRACVRAGSPRPTIGECTMVVQSSPPRPCASPRSDRRSSCRCRLRRCGSRRCVHVAPTMFTSMPFTPMPFTSMWFTPTC